MIRQAAITGIGIVSAIGSDLASFRQSLFSGRSGVRRIDGRALPVPYAADVAGFVPPAGFERADRSVQFAIAAARAAVADAGLCGAPAGRIGEYVDSDRAAVSIASSKGGVASICELRERLARTGGPVEPAALADLFANCWPSTPAAAVAADLGFRGPTAVPAAACAAGSHAVIDGALMIERGEADIVIAGATEASIIPLISAGFCQLGVLAPDGVCRPFDRDRSGFAIGEGAAMLILENTADARARGAGIYAGIAGHVRAADATGIVALDESGASVASAITRALHRAAIECGTGVPPVIPEPREVDYINAHATGTRLNDIIETRAIKAAFGSHARDVAVSGTKPITGHLLGAAGAIETAICAIALRHQMIPPTINLRTRDPECDLDLVCDARRPAAVDVVMNLSFGFGGQIGVLVLTRDGFR